MKPQSRDLDRNQTSKVPLSNSHIIVANIQLFETKRFNQEIVVLPIIIGSLYKLFDTVQLNSAL